MLCQDSDHLQFKPCLYVLYGYLQHNQESNVKPIPYIYPSEVKTYVPPTPICKRLQLYSSLAKTKKFYIVVVKQQNKFVKIHRPKKGDLYYMCIIPQ